MDISAFVRKQTSNVAILQELTTGKIHANFILVIDTAMTKGKDVLEKLVVSATVIDASRLGVTDVQQPVYLKDMTVQLINEKTDTLRVLSTKAKSFQAPVCILTDIQADILPDQTVLATKYLADICVTMLGNGMLHVTRRIPGGKAMVETCHFTEGKFSKIEEPSQPVPVSSTAPTSTFNLDITPDQANAKANVLLPHLRVQLEEVSISKPILAGDYDEEDPDDDLEI